ncbi:hypothetical protein AAG906_025777 [Vitis piasezkii]
MFLFCSSCFLDWVLVLSLDLPHWIRVEGRLIRFLEAGYGSAGYSQQSRQFVVQDETPCDSRPHLPPPLVQAQPERTLFHQGVDPKGRCMVDGFRWKPIIEPTNVDQLKRYYV